VAEPDELVDRAPERALGVLVVPSPGVGFDRAGADLARA
jgi:hypothetical protein